MILFCFDENTQVQNHNGDLICVKHLEVGNRILSIKNIDKLSEEPFYDDVTNVTIIEGGSFPSHVFHFENGKSITTTSPHIMAIFKVFQCTANILWMLKDINSF